MEDRAVGIDDHFLSGLGVGIGLRLEPRFRSLIPLALKPEGGVQSIIRDGVPGGDQGPADHLIALGDLEELFGVPRVEGRRQEAGRVVDEEKTVGAVGLRQNPHLDRHAAAGADGGGLQHQVVDLAALDDRQERVAGFQIPGHIGDREVAVGEQQAHAVVDHQAAQVVAHRGATIAQRNVFAGAVFLDLEAIGQVVVERPLQHAGMDVEREVPLGIVEVALDLADDCPEHQRAMWFVRAMRARWETGSERRVNAPEAASTWSSWAPLWGNISISSKKASFQPPRTILTLPASA